MGKILKNSNSVRNSKKRIIKSNKKEKTTFLNRIKDFLPSGSNKDSPSVLKCLKKRVFKKKPNYLDDFFTELFEFFIYRYWKRNGTYYIGQTKNLEIRKSQHEESQREILDFEILDKVTGTRSDAEKVEKKYIEKYASEKCLNKKHNKRWVDWRENWREKTLGGLEKKQ